MNRNLLNGRIGMILHGFAVTLGFFIPFAAGYVAKAHGALGAILVFVAMGYSLYLDFLWFIRQESFCINAGEVLWRDMGRVFVWFTMVCAFIGGCALAMAGNNFSFEFNETFGCLLVATGWVRALMMWHVSGTKKAPTNG